MNDYKVGDYAMYDGHEAKIVGQMGHYDLYLIQWKDRDGWHDTHTTSAYLQPVPDLKPQISTHIENLHAAYKRAVARDAAYDALKQERRFTDAENIEPGRNAAFRSFFYAFVKLVASDPSVWEKLK